MMGNEAVTDTEFTSDNFKNWLIKHNDSRGYYSHDLFDGLRNEKILRENFFKWPIDRQREIIYATEFVEIDPTEIATFFAVRAQLQDERPELRITWNMSIDACYRMCMEEFSAHGFDHSAFDSSLLEFQSIIGMFSMSMRTVPRATVTMLAILYGETLTTKALEKIVAETHSSTLTELYTLVRNWNQWREYPIAWMQNLHLKSDA